MRNAEHVKLFNCKTNRYRFLRKHDKIAMKNEEIKFCDGFFSDAHGDNRFFSRFCRSHWNNSKQHYLTSLSIDGKHGERCPYKLSF